jgi:hypothetical protein
VRRHGITVSALTNDDVTEISRAVRERLSAAAKSAMMRLSTGRSTRTDGSRASQSLAAIGCLCSGALGAPCEGRFGPV